MAGKCPCRVGMGHGLLPRFSISSSSKMSKSPKGSDSSYFIKVEAEVREAGCYTLRTYIKKTISRLREDEWLVSPKEMACNIAP